MWTILLVGCFESPPAFECSDEKPCQSGRSCVYGACAKADETCTWGYRWDDTAGSLASRCVSAPRCGNSIIDDGETCDPGSDSPLTCPTAETCDDQLACTVDEVAGTACVQVCTHRAADSGALCSLEVDGVEQGGVCQAAVCCAGCWTTDGYCQSGHGVSACGHGGEMCADCGIVGEGECANATCGSSWSCEIEQKLDQTQCEGGLCLGGACCTGCEEPVDGGLACRPGTEQVRCGSGASPCVNCTEGCDVVDGGNRCHNCTPSCDGGRECGGDQCGGNCGQCLGGWECSATGQCHCTGVGAENNDFACRDSIDNDCNRYVDCQDSGCHQKRCAVQGKFCQFSACHPGCRIDGSVYAPQVPNAGDSCQWCEPAQNDEGWTYRPELEDQPCTSTGGIGRCKHGKCCTGCVDPATDQCVPSAEQTNRMCQSQGRKCEVCPGDVFCTACNQGVCGTLPDDTWCEAHCGLDFEQFFGPPGGGTLPVECIGCGLVNCRIGKQCRSGFCTAYNECCNPSAPRCCSTGAGMAYCALSCGGTPD